MVYDLETVGYDSTEMLEKVSDDLDFLEHVIEYCNGDVFAIEQYMSIYNNNFLIPIVEHVIWQNEKKRRT